MTIEEAKNKINTFNFLDFQKDIVNDLIDKIYNDLNNRTCENCNYFTGKVCYLHEGWNEDVGVVHPIMEKDDGCNKWEDKNKEN